MPRAATMMGLIDKLDGSYVTVHQERCVTVRNRNATCLRCAEACTSGCISYDGETLAVSPDRCIGCGTCATVCPTCALEAHHPGDEELANACVEAMSAAEGVACIACAQLLDRAAGLYAEDRTVRVECLGRVEESLLTLLAARGAREIVLVHGACASCEHRSGWEAAQAVCDTERQLLEAWRSLAKVRLSAKLPGVVRAGRAAGDASGAGAAGVASGARSGGGGRSGGDGEAGRGGALGRMAYDEGRRSAFEQGGRAAARLGALVADAVVSEALDDLGVRTADAEASSSEPRYVKVMDDGTLPHFLPDRRERLLDALASLGEPYDVMVNTRLWGHVIIDTDACTSCQMCAVFCPTGAISKFQDEDGTFGVEHYPGDCVKCRCCTSICPAGALELSEEVFAVDMLAGMVDRYEMKPLAVERSKPHTIWKTMKTLTKTSQVYER